MEKTMTFGEMWKAWWSKEIAAAQFVGLRLTRKAAAKLVLFWLSVFATGALLWTRGLDGYGLVAAGTMWLSGAAVIGELGGNLKEEDR